MSRNSRSAMFAVGALGLYYAWRNRFRIQQSLESRGIRTPSFDTGRLSDKVRSGFSKVSGRIEKGARDTQDQMDRAI